MVLLDDRLIFPDPLDAPEHVLLAVGGDLSTERLMLAYRSGIFPWYSDGEPICWWSPDPRMVFDLTADQPMRITKSLKQSRRNRGYIVKFNTDFEQVIANCRHSPRIGQDGTWLNDEMQQAYLKLNELGHAKSVAVYKNDELVGGLYGIDLPESKIFCGESMFSKHRDASKIALWWLVEKLQADGYRYIDGQVQNDHLESLGGITLSRKRFLQQLYNW